MGAILFLVAFALPAIFELASSTHPSYISCSNSGDEGTIAIYNNSTLLQCRNGSQVAEYCISSVKGPYFECVDHPRVLSKLKSYMNGYLAAVVKDFFTDDSRNFANCDKLKKEGYLSMFKNKTDCTKDFEKLVPATATGGPVLNDMCTLKNKKVHYLDDEGFYSCKNGIFELQKCVIKMNYDSEYFCVDKKKVENALRASQKLDEFLERQNGSFCSNFLESIRTTFNNYGNELVLHKHACDDDDIPETESALTEIPAASTDSSDLSETARAILKDAKPYHGGRKIFSEMQKCKEQGINFNGIWYQCGVPTKCVKDNGKCLHFRAIEVMFRNYQKAKRGWNNKRYNEIKNSLRSEHREIYEDLILSETGDDYTLFNSLAKLVDDEPESNKIVTIKVKDSKTMVTPQVACHIINKLAPFGLRYINKRVKNC